MDTITAVLLAFCAGYTIIGLSAWAVYERRHR